MHFPTLAAQSNLPAGVAATMNELILRKASTRELGAAPLPNEIKVFIEDEFEKASAEFAGPAPKPSAEAVAAAETLFRRHMWS